MRFNKVLAALACTVGLAGAHATVLVKTTQTTFEQAVVGGAAGLWIDDLERFDGDNGVTPIDLEFSHAVNPMLTGLLSGDTSTQSIAAQGRSSHNGGNAYWLGGDGSGSSFTITFDSSITAFGFWASDVGDFRTDCEALDPRPASCDNAQASFLKVILTLKDANGNLSTFTEEITDAGANGNERFRGFVSDLQIVSAEFINQTNGADGQGFDYFMVAEAGDIPQVPEPSGVALAGLALLAASRVTRRVRR